MKEYEHDIKRLNYRAWKSGKRWLYASIALASIIGGIVLESTGVTPKMLSYIRKDTSTGIASAMSTSATILMRGAVLQSDFYASVGDFSVPKTVGQDFANNATIAVEGKINPWFNGPIFTVPSAPNSNAVAAFNQPLDPSKDFSISAEITVNDARVAAAGIYISDVAPDDIVTMLGVGNNNGKGSSGALKEDKNAYTDHYMLFSGFHNSGGFAAILASGTDYTRLGPKVSTDGNSLYMDRDYVGFGSNRDGVKIWATIDYRAATGTATVVYRHNSATTGSDRNGYNASTKTATVQFQIDSSSPVYLGIVGNGDRNDSSGNFTSRSVVTSVTGTYLTKDRFVEFKDDANNILAAPSKVLMPRGGRLGIGNNDSTTLYYFDKPDMPQGYTYLTNLNPSVGNDKNVIVKYQRDVQTGYVERINKMTAQNIDPSKNVVIKGVTNQTLSVKVPGIPGYYFVNDITGDAKNPNYASNGSTVDFNITMDDTSNGTSATDSQEQVIQTYMMPSIQERVLTITKPDGKILTEKQTSTTDTDFTTLGGQYVIPGYRAVIDGKAVSDVEASQGIPGEPTDRTDNLKSTTDSVPQKHTVTYQAEPQKAVIIYKDVTTGVILKTDTLVGSSDTLMPYDTASKIANYKGYIVKSNNFTDGAEKFDTVTGVDQDYLIELVHDSKSQSETKNITHEVAYSVKHGIVPAPLNYATKATITYSYFVDQVTGNKITSQFSDYAVNGAVNDSPEAPKYASDHPDATVDASGLITFASPLVPSVQDHTPTVTENSTINYSAAKDGEKLVSSVLYQLDDTINVTIPTNTIFYNQTTDVKIKAPVYKITNNSGAPVKVSVDGFTPAGNNPTMPTDFLLNLNVTGKKVTSSSAKLVEKGLVQTASKELMTLANCLDQYDKVDTAVTKGTAVDNIATFTYDGSATTSDVRKLDYTLSLKFESIQF